MQHVSFDILPGEILALVGESGSGKSITALSMLGLVPDPGRVQASSISLAGRDLVGLPFKEMRKIRGKDIGVIFQEPSASLNPAYTIGDQVAEPLRTHLGMSKKQARARVIELLELVGIPQAAPAPRRLPPPVLGGHGPAGDDRHGPGLRAQAADRRRAHHRPRRDRPGPGARPAARPAARVRHVDPAHHPRPRRRGRRGRPGRGDVRRPDHRDGLLTDVFRSPATPTPRACCWPCPATSGGSARCRRSPAWCRRRGSGPTSCHFAPRCRYAADDCRAAPVPLEVDGRAGAAAASGPTSCRCGASPTASRLVEVAEAAGWRTDGNVGQLDGTAATTASRRDGCAAEPATGRGGRRCSTSATCRSRSPAPAACCPGKRGPDVRAVVDASLHVGERETVGLVGESGSGKTTIGRASCASCGPPAGTIRLGDYDVTAFGRKVPQSYRRAGAGRLPGPGGLAEPLDHRRRHHRRAAEAALRHGRRRPPAPGHRAARAGGPGRPPPRALPLRVLRRAAPAHRRGPGPGLRAPADRAGRAGLRPRRVHPEPGHQPARAAAGRDRRRLPAHRPRPRRRAPRQPAHLRDVPQPHRGGGPGRPGLRAAGAPLHRAAAGLDPRRRSRPASGPSAPCARSCRSTRPRRDRGDAPRRAARSATAAAT